MCSYPLDAPVEVLYNPSLSNSAQYRAASKSLFKKLANKKMADSFHEQMTKSIKEGHAHVIPPDELKNVLGENHCFSGINYALKEEGSHKVRLVTNSSSNHVSGSLNSHLPTGPNYLANLKVVFMKFRLKFYAIMLDLARAYRSLHSTPEAGRLRLMWWISSVQEAEQDLDKAMRVYELDRVTYGDQPASVFLELALRMVIAPQCKTELGRTILANDRYVDDCLSSHSKKEEMLEAVCDMEATLQEYGFSIKRVISNSLWFHEAMGLLNPDGTDHAGLFAKDEVSEVTFHHHYDWKQDTLKIAFELNFYPKNRGRSTGPPLSQCDVSSIPVTKAVLARLTGQCYQVVGSFLDPILIGFKILFSQGCKHVQNWKQQIDDKDFLLAFRDYISIVKGSYKQLLEWPRLIVPHGFSIKRIILHSDGGLHASSWVLFIVSEGPDQKVLPQCRRRQQDQEPLHPLQRDKWTGQRSNQCLPLPP